MPDKPKKTNEGYKDFQSALESVGADAMEKAINAAFQQIAGDEIGNSQPQSVPADPVSSSCENIKQISIQSIELAIAEAFGKLTGESYDCLVRGFSFHSPENVSIDLVLKKRSGM
ncbi:MAG: hypothetical protein M0P57_06515 [Syntrophales bacterium]|jgi:hypothetical protein|nr:hypothetical protein [Syntrophales bacterium]MDY0044147.1 hypothetical protein [Syntrophales bacterium]